MWRDTTNPGTEVVATGSGAPLGFIERTINHDNFDIEVEGTLAISEGSNVTVADDATGAIGAPVYTEPATGAVTFTSTGTTVDTGYVAMTAGNSGDLVIISNWIGHGTKPSA